MAEGYFCDLCGKKFETQEALNAHRGQAHPQEHDLDCPCCDESFASRAVLSQHLQITHGNELENQCPYCSKKFHRMVGLRIHVAKKHPDKLKEFDVKKGLRELSKYDQKKPSSCQKKKN